MNLITERIHYITEDSEENQRLIISSLSPNPSVWIVSKIQDINPFGVLKLTYKQTVFDEHTDFIDWETGDMYADYYVNNIAPIDEDVKNNITSVVTALNNYIKVGGSYKLLTVKFTDDDGNDVTDQYSELITLENWKCSVDDVDMTDNELITWLPQTEFNKMKIKFGKDLSFLSKVLKIQCVVDNIIGEIELELRN